MLNVVDCETYQFL